MKKYIKTQIASTPIISGESAKIILSQIKNGPSQETEKGKKILFELFDIDH